MHTAANLVSDHAVVSACRGVVRLFNAVAKAQKQQEEAQEGGAKAKGAAQISKAAFLAELQGKLAKPQVHLHCISPYAAGLVPGAGNHIHTACS